MYFYVWNYFTKGHSLWHSHSYSKEFAINGLEPPLPLSWLTLVSFWLQAIECQVGNPLPPHDL